MQGRGHQTLTLRCELCSPLNANTPNSNCKCKMKCLSFNYWSYHSSERIFSYVHLYPHTLMIKVSTLKCYQFFEGRVCIDANLWIQTLFWYRKTFCIRMNCKWSYSISFKVENTFCSILCHKLNIATTLVTDDIFINIFCWRSIISLGPPKMYNQY